MRFGALLPRSGAELPRVGDALTMFVNDARRARSRSQCGEDGGVQSQKIGALQQSTNDCSDYLIITPARFSTSFTGQDPPGSLHRSGIGKPAR
jgi:hypothetical protein